MSQALTSQRPTSVSVVRGLTLVAVFAAFIAALGTIPPLQALPPPISPITAQTLGVMLAGSVLGARRGAAAVLVFLVLVAAGLPFLSGGRGGLGVFAGPSAGFLLGWVFGAYVTGWLVERRPRTRTGLAIFGANAVGGIGVVYLFGLPWLAHVAGLHDVVFKSLVGAIFLPGDIAKAIIATVLTTGLLRGYPDAVVPGRGHA